MLSRREFGAATGSLVALQLCRLPAFAQGTLPARRSVGTLAPDDPDLLAYRRAVEAMQALPPTDPRNWQRQAQIHDDHCPHGNWYFLPWHRAYLVAFERICRQLSGKADFALPYWDWTVDRQLPPAFTSGTSVENKLNHPRPGFDPGDSLSDEFVGEEVIRFILDSPDFESLGSRRTAGQNSAALTWLRKGGETTELEGTPHNNVHRILSGDMGGFQSPRDPIFWLHHCNVDRLWAQWNADHLNSDESFWLDMDLSGQFANADGSAWSVKVADMAGRSTDTLGYRYEAAPQIAEVAERDTRLAQFRSLQSGARIRSLEEGGPETVELPGGSRGHLAATTNTRSADKNTPLSIPVKIGTSIEQLVPRQLIAPSGEERSVRSAEALRSGQSPRVTAQILNVEAPRDKSTFIRVFVNHDNLKPDTPISDPHYVTSLAFFAEDHHGDAHDSKRSFSVDITSALAKAERAGSLDGDQIVVQLVVIGEGEVSGTAVTPAAVEVTVL